MSKFFWNCALPYAHRSAQVKPFYPLYYDVTIFSPVYFSINMQIDVPPVQGIVFLCSKFPRK